MSTFPIDSIRDQLVAFCQRWKIQELALFGSILRDDFSPRSDIDMLVTFAEDATWSLFDHIKMEQELELLFQRKVDLLTKRAVEQSQNSIRRETILRSARTLIAS